MNEYCSFDGCSRDAHAVGMCKAHYEQRRRGEEMRPLKPRRASSIPSAEWFWAQTTRRGECRDWNLAVNSHGYGQVSVQGRTVQAHRFAFMLSGATIPDGMLVDHRCRNRRCVEPRHLRLATKKQNAENVGLRKDNTSGVRGVTWAAQRRRWMVTVTHNGRHINGGYFRELEDAKQRATELRRGLYTHSEENLA
jgi:hypothetical protein